jgi:YidC/Oxa1 family membrane protein insertase
MDENNRNFLLAIILSVFVLIGWQYFFAVPHIEEERARQETSLQKPEPGTPGPAADSAPPQPGAQPGAPQPQASPAPSAPAPDNLTREGALAAGPRIPLETPNVRGSIALRGARIDDVVLREYRQTVAENSPNVVLLSPAGAPDAFYLEHGFVAGPGANVAVPTPETEWRVEGEGALTPQTPVTLVWDNGAGLIFRRAISVDDNAMFTVRQEVVNNGESPVTLHPYALVSRHGIPKIENVFVLHEGLIGVLGADGLREVDYQEAIDDPVSAQNLTGGWLGITDKYWAAVAIPPQDRSYAARIAGVAGATPRFQSDYLLAPIMVGAGETAAVESRAFAGAKEVDRIDAYQETLGIPKFDLLIDWGWFYFLTKPLFYALDFFYKLVGNFGVSILIVTVIIKLILFPLANKSYVAMSKMKKLAPEMQRIKERYGDDKVRMQQAMMEMYKKEQVNPASGCLPILVQIPVFFALYKVLYVTIEMRHAPFFGWIRDLSAPDPTTIFNLFGLIPWNPGSVPFIGALLIVGIWPIIMGVTMWVQMKLNPPPPDPIQQQIFGWMPIIFTFLLASFPAGLVIYWAWNNLLSIAQQWFIMARQGVEVNLFENMGFKKKAEGEGKT